MQNKENNLEQTKKLWLIASIMVGYNILTMLLNKTYPTITWSITIFVILEEFLFRELLLQRWLFKEKINYQLAIIIAAAIFGLLHIFNHNMFAWQTIIQTIYAFAFGLLAGFMVYEYKTIMPTIIIHLLINITAGKTIQFIDIFPAIISIGFLTAPIIKNIKTKK